MKRLIVFYFLFFSICTVIAQVKQGVSRFISGIDVQVDGNLEEWHQQLSEIDDVNPHWAYAVGYNDTSLFVAVRVSDRALQLEAAAHGIAVMVNKEGKKKEGMQLIFPNPDGETIRSMLEAGDFSSAHVRSELISRSRGFRVQGFPKIIDGLLSKSNTYGIRAVAKVDAEDSLVYECVIPLAHLELNKITNPIAVRITINNRWSGLSKSVFRDRQSSSRQKALSKENTIYKGKTEVWIIDQLLRK